MVKAAAAGHVCKPTKKKSAICHSQGGIACSLDSSASLDYHTSPSSCVLLSLHLSGFLRDCKLIMEITKGNLNFLQTLLTVRFPSRRTKNLKLGI